MIKGIREGRTWLLFLQFPLAWLLLLCSIGSLETEDTVMVPFLLLASSRQPDSLQEKVILRSQKRYWLLKNYGNWPGDKSQVGHAYTCIHSTDINSLLNCAPRISVLEDGGAQQMIMHIMLNRAQDAVGEKGHAE